jgi:hypothetical protein
MTAGDNILVFTSNSSGVKDVMNNALTALDFKLLAIEENISPGHASFCLYDPCKTDFSCCSVSEADHAHLYISTNILNQHCIILFADKTLSKFGDINGLVEKFYNSIERFKKQNSGFPDINGLKPLRFFVYFYGNDPPLTIQNYNKYHNLFSGKLEKRLGYRKHELDSCVLARTIRRTGRLTVSQKDNLLQLNFS